MLVRANVPNLPKASAVVEQCKRVREQGAKRLARDCRYIIQGCLRGEEWQDADQELFDIIAPHLKRCGTNKTGVWFFLASNLGAFGFDFSRNVPTQFVGKVCGQRVANFEPLAQEHDFDIRVTSSARTVFSARRSSSRSKSGRFGVG